MILLTASLGFPLLALAVGVYQFVKPDSWYTVDYNSQCYGVSVFGDEVRVILETASHPHMLPDSPTIDENVRGYLLSATLGQPEKLASTRKITGPLYELLNPISSIANSSGGAFTTQDRKALSEKPYFSFRVGTRLAKSIMVDRDASHDWLLEADGKTANWKDVGRHISVFPKGWSPNDYFGTKSMRYFVQKEPNGKTRVCDVLNSKYVEDSWLTNVGKLCLVDRDFRGYEIELSEDLNLVIVWNGPKNGQYLVFARPSVVERVYTDDSGAPISIDGKLFFVSDFRNPLAPSNSEISIRSADTGAKYIHQFAPNEAWIKGVGTWVRHDPDRQRLLFINSDKFFVPNVEQATILIATWEYRQDVVRQYSLSLEGLFRKERDGYHPINGIVVHPPDN